MSEDSSPLHDRFRRQTRVDAAFFVEILHNGRPIPAELIDLSLIGASLRCSQRLRAGTYCDLLIRLHNRHNTDLPVRCAARVVRHIPPGMVLELLEFYERDGYENLRNLILLHAEDPARAAAEMAHNPVKRPNPSGHFAIRA